jgi:hypothetical protein
MPEFLFVDVPAEDCNQGTEGQSSANYNPKENRSKNNTEK